MGIGKGFRLLVVAAVLAVPATAFAHAHLTDPPSRPGTNDTTIKIGPCGNLPRSGSFVQYDAGATVTVAFEETIAHQGCYQFRLSTTGDDKNFQLLKQVNDPAGLGGKQTTQVTLPSGVTCEKCTLQMLQLMIGTTCAANQDPTAAMNAGNVYYSCADVRIGDFPDAGTSADSGTTTGTDGGSSSSSSGGTTTVPTDGGGKTTNADPDDSTGSRNLRAGAGDDGCNVGFGAGGGLSFFVSAGVGAMALMRRRRRR